MSETKSPDSRSPQEATKSPVQVAGSGAERVPFASRILRTVLSQSTAAIVVAILTALVVSALLVTLADKQTQAAASYFFARPTDALAAAWASFSGFFTSLFRGCIYDYQASSSVLMFKPITETLTRSVPLIIAGLAFTVAFRAGLFNIGVQGQLIFGSVLAGIIGFRMHLPVGVHLLLCLAGAMLGGLIYGLVAGLLKSLVNANEVIVTIMLNSIATYFLAYFLKTKFFIGEGISGRSLMIAPTAELPQLLGSTYRVHLGFIIALLITVFVWWILERSTFGFQLRAAGANPTAAETAGINVKYIIFWTMAISGALAGLAGSAPVLGTEKLLSQGVAANYGFDAITVSLLGKATPVGTLASGLLFGALSAASAQMQSSAGIPVDIVMVTQAVIVLMIAAADAMNYYRAKAGKSKGSAKGKKVA